MTGDLSDEIARLRDRIDESKEAIKQSMFDAEAMSRLSAELRALTQRLAELEQSQRKLK
jgi:predicted  nucleic acid-binding Zn-ribbon protein